ncbi:MAG: AsmA-like C-terminal region-containing protein, partial [Opitutales bacterium]
LRFCLSCALTLVCWALWLALGGLLAVQLYIAAAREVPVPDFLLRRIETQLNAANLEVRFGGAHFEPSGHILLEDVRLRSRLFEDPLLVSRLVFFRKSLWSVLSGRPLPDELQLEGATLQLPAILSPSGGAEPLLRDFAGTLHYEDGAWQITQLAGYVGPLRVTLHGAVAAARQPGTTTVTLEELTSRYLRTGRALALQLPRLQALEQPELDVLLVSHGPGDATVGLRFTAGAAHHPDGLPLELGELTVTGDWIWTDRTPRPLHLRAEIDRVNVDDAVTADRLRLQDDLLPRPDLSGLREVRLRAAATALHGIGETLDRPVVEASFSLHDGVARAATAFLTHGELLTASARGDLTRRTAEVGFAGRVPPALVTGLLTRFGPKLEPYFRFGDPVVLHGTAWFTEGWRFDRLSTRALVGRLDSHGVHVTSARGRIDADAAGNFLASDALATIGENYARGSYWMNFRTRDYRMLLAGQLHPPEISGWFRGNWWPEFWKSFSFPAAPPRADVDVQGCWFDPNRTSYFGSTDAVSPSALGADFERAHAVLFLRPNFSHLLEVEAERAGGTQRVTGWFKRYADRATHSTTAWEYDLQGNPEPELYARAAGALVAGPLAAWRFTQPPRVHLHGRSDLLPGDGYSHELGFEATAAEGLHYSEFPLERLAVQGGIHGTDLHLDRIEFSAAGGSGTARAALTGPPGARQLEFDATVKEADLARAIRGVEAMAAARAGAKGAPLADSRFIKRANGGKLDLTIAAQAGLADPASLRGKGSVQITGAELGEIHLFGLLSQVLSAVWLNFSSLKLDSARSSFTLADGRVHFPDVRISGPSAVIEAKGDYLIAPKTLDFTARLKPYEDTRNPLMLPLIIVFNPLTSIFELKLSGPIAKPNWSMTIGPS